MAIYLGLVLTKQWKAGTPILVDEEVKMTALESWSPVTHDDFGTQLDQQYALCFQQAIEN